jgi:glycosyltransferase involved in cell wall biosynthesis
VILQSFDPADLPDDFADRSSRKGRGRHQTTTSLKRLADAALIEDLPNDRWFEVCVLAHLRKVKDPLLAARAAHRLPEGSRIRVCLIGGVLEPAYERALQKELERNPRLHWMGSVSRARALARLARSNLLVNSSLLEGGANAVSEAIAMGIPVLASHIPGNVGLLGESYPGYFRTGDEEELAALLSLCEEDGRFLSALARHVRRLAPRFHPEHEVRSWSKLLGELGLTIPRTAAATRQQTTRRAKERPPRQTS